MSLKNMFVKRVVRRAALLAEVSAMCLLSSSAMAAIVNSPATNVVVPNTIDGIYINIVTGATGTTAATAPAGWDIDPYGASNTFNIYWPPGPANSSGGVVAAATTTPFILMNVGDTVGPASTFSRTVGATSPNFRVTGTNVLGFRFFNEATSAINYGYARIQTTATGGFPATILSMTYDDTGAAITIPAAAAPPQFLYNPAAGGPVNFTGGTTLGSTGTASIAATIGTAGSGTGASATTTTTCTAPTAPFSGFGQSVTAEGAAASTTGGPLSGTCTVGATQVTQTLTCSENRGGSAVAVTFTLTCPAATVGAPQFTYSPAAGSAVNFSGGTLVGSTGNASIAATIGTPGLGTGAAATTTTTCTAPTAPFSGFGQSVTAEGAAASTTGGPLSGSCVLGASQVVQTLTCSENQGGTPVTRTFDLTCPAGTAATLTSAPVSGSTVTLPSQIIGTGATNAAISFQNPGLVPATVTCVAPAAPFTANPLTINVPAGGSASTTVSFNSATAGVFAGTLTCSAGQQQFTFALAGTANAPSVPVPAMNDYTRLLLVISALLMGMVTLGLRARRG